MGRVISTPLGDWLKETGFTRPNFMVMRPHLLEGRDYVVREGRYLIDSDSIKVTIMTLDWARLL